MNHVAEKLSEWFGSTPFIVMHIVWFAAWYPLGGKTDMLTVIVSLEAIFLALFILRAENVESARMERYIRETRLASNKDLEISKRIEKRLK